jgi:hypothetical protein
MLLSFEPRRYYTDLSLALFFLAIVLKKSVLKTALLLNSVLVGLVGNIIVIRGMSDWVAQGYDAKELLYSNFLKHTLPMVLALILLAENTPRESSRYVLLLGAMFLLWSTIPYNGRTMTQKVRESYDMSADVLVTVFVVIIVSTCKTLQYFNNRY